MIQIQTLFPPKQRTVANGITCTNPKLILYNSIVSLLVYIALYQLRPLNKFYMLCLKMEILMRERNARTGRVRMHTGAGEDMVMSCTCQASMNNCALYCNVLILHLCCILLLCNMFTNCILLPAARTCQLWWRFIRYILNCVHIILKYIACRLVLDLTGFVEQQRGLKPLFRYVSTNANGMAHKNKET